MTPIDTCPLCRKKCKHRDHVRSHLHEDHYKSEIIDEYLDTIEERNRPIRR